MPGYHLGKRLYHDEIRDPVVGESGLCSVSEPQSSHYHGEVPGVPGQAVEGQIREGNFDRGEEAGHEIAGPEDDFVDLQVVERAETASAQGEVAEGCFPEIQFFVVEGHVKTDSAGRDQRRRARTQ